MPTAMQSLAKAGHILILILIKYFGYLMEGYEEPRSNNRHSGGGGGLSVNYC